MTLSFAPDVIEMWPLARLQPYAKNAKAHGSDQVAKIAASMATKKLSQEGGAVLLEPNTEGNGIIDTQNYTDGSGREFLHQKAGGSVKPPSHETVDAREHYVYQEGQSVFKFAVKGMADVSVEMMERNNLEAEDVAYLVPHQANLRIINAVQKALGVDPDAMVVNVQNYGNTGSASVPLALWEARGQGRIDPGDLVLLTAFGAGFHWAAALVRF